MPPVFVRFSGVAPDSDAMVTETASDAVAAGSPALAASASGGGAAASPANSNKRNPKARTSASGGAASSAAAAIQIAAGSPPRKRGGLPPNHGAPQTPEEMDGLDDDDDDDAHRNGEAVDGEDGKVGLRGTATMLRCRYSELYGNSSPTKAQMMATEESERSSADAEVDAKRVKEELLGCLITLGPMSTLPVDSEVYKGTGRWHYVVEGSRDEVVRYLRLTEAKFQISGERTSAVKSQDWAVNLAWDQA